MFVAENEYVSTHNKSCHTPLPKRHNGADDTFGTEDDNLRLQANSRCIDDGYNNAVTETTDLDGRVRIFDGDMNSSVIVDMGAYEFTCAYFGDLDGDCDVDLIDLSILTNDWLSYCTGPDWCDSCDIDLSGKVNIFDFTL